MGMLNRVIWKSSVLTRLVARAHSRRHQMDPISGRALPRAPFIVGAPRSGTTLLRLMLDAHSDLAIPPETGFLPHTLPILFGTDEYRWRAFLNALVACPSGTSAWPDFDLEPQALMHELHTLKPFALDEGIRCFYRMYAARFGKTRWGDKTPMYGRYLRAIESVLPEAAFIHIIRDGRDVALSLRTLWFSPGSDMATLARKWCEDVRATRLEARHCSRYLEVRYEALVRSPESVLREVCDFIGVEYEATMMNYFQRAPERLLEHRARIRADGTVLVSREQRLSQQRLVNEPPDPSRIGRWKMEMLPHERARYEAIAGDLLTELGYDMNHQEAP